MPYVLLYLLRQVKCKKGFVVYTVPQLLSLVQYFLLLQRYTEKHELFLDVNVQYIFYRTPLTLPISKRDSLLEKDTMFRDSGGALTRQSSQDNGPDGAYPSTTNKLEQVDNTRSQQFNH